MTNPRIKAVRRTTQMISQHFKPVIQQGRAFAERYPEALAGAMVGYSTGMMVEKIPLVRPLLGPTPRVAGLVLGAFAGQCFKTAWAEVKAEQGA
jgi:hypothetical protein